MLAWEGDLVGTPYRLGFLGEDAVIVVGGSNRIYMCMYIYIHMPIYAYMYNAYFDSPFVHLSFSFYISSSRATVSWSEVMDLGKILGVVGATGSTMVSWESQCLDVSCRDLQPNNRRNLLVMGSNLEASCQYQCIPRLIFTVFAVNWQVYSARNCLCPGPII